MFVISALLGFVCFDLLYMAVVMMYTSQSQLLRFFISSITDKVQTKAYSLGDAIKVRGGRSGSWRGEVMVCEVRRCVVCEM